MMAGTFKEYNWDDIIKLIYADAGLKTDAERRSLGSLYLMGGLTPPHHKDTCVQVYVYSKPLNERVKEHIGDLK